MDKDQTAEDEVVDRGDDLLPPEPEGNADVDQPTPPADEDKGQTPPEGEEATAGADDTPADPPAEDSDEDTGKGGITIPKERFDEAQRRNRDRIADLEEELNKLKTPAEPDTRSADLAELEDKYEDLLIEGEREKAKAVRKEIAELRTSIETDRAQETADTVRASAVEAVRYEEALTRLEGLYPAINPDVEQFDAAVTDEIGGLYAALLGQGLQRAHALDRAVRYVLGSPAAPEAAPAPPAPAEADADAARRVAEETRQAEARATAAAAASAQPPAAGDVGDSSASAGKANTGGPITQARFDGMDDKEKAIARGDVLA